MTIADSRPHREAEPGPVARALKKLMGSTEEAAKTSRLAGLVFLIRVASAALAYASQVLLARWMGGGEYGVYVYVWTWVLLLGSLMDFGISVSAQKLIPEYRAQQQLELLRGFLSGSRWLTLVISTALSLALAAVVHTIAPRIDPRSVVPLYLACLTLPGFVVATVQDGIARSYDWMRLALLPQFLVRQSLILAFSALAWVCGLPVDADVAMLASAGAVWIAMIGQLVVLNRRLRTVVETGKRSHDVGGWLKISLPILLAEGFYQLLTYTDILVLQQFRPSEEVGIYFAVVKTLSLVSFIHYAMSATTAHRFSAYHAAGETERLSAYVAYAIRWTFWPSFAATVVLLIAGKPLLWLFGSSFTSGHGIMFVAAVGLVARAAIGPVERLLNMLGQQHLCALAYALAFALNLLLCWILIPSYGGYGAAAATSTSLIFETVLLFIITQRRLGLRVFAFGKIR